MKRDISEEARRTASNESRRAQRERYCNPLNIRTPVVEDDARRAKWYGVPPTPLATAPVWRPKDVF